MTVWPRMDAGQAEHKQHQRRQAQRHTGPAPPRPVPPDRGASRLGPAPGPAHATPRATPGARPGRRSPPVPGQASVSRCQRRPVEATAHHTSMVIPRYEPAAGPDYLPGDQFPIRLPGAMTGTGPLDSLQPRSFTCIALSLTRSGRRIMNVEITGLDPALRPHHGRGGADLQAGPGVFGLLAPTGAGKTKPLPMMATAVPPPPRADTAARPRSGPLRTAAGDPAPLPGTCRRTSATTPASRWPSSWSTALLKDMPPARVQAAVAAADERVELEQQGEGQAAHPVRRDV